jgi:cell division protein FtsL
MDDQAAPAQNSDKPDTAALPVNKTEPSNPETAKPATAQQLANVKKDMSGFERATLRWAKVAVLMSGLAAIFVCAQWWEMHSGGQDTHTLAQQAITQTTQTTNLASAAKTQSEKMSNMADAADKIQQAANGMVTEEKRLADSSHESLENNALQNRAALNNTIEEFRLEHRAWVSVSEIVFLRVASDGTTTPVQLNQIQPNDNIAVNVTYKNTGTTPAFNVVDTSRLDSFPTTAPAFKPFVKGANYGILQPGEQIFQTMYLENLTPDNVTAFKSSLVHVYGRIDYHDAFGVARWATFCRLILNTGAQAECPEQADTTDNEPKPN